MTVVYLFIITYNEGQPVISSIDLYHTAAILSPRRTKSFVFACLASLWIRLALQNLLFQHCVIKVFRLNDTVQIIKIKEYLLIYAHFTSTCNVQQSLLMLASKTHLSTTSNDTYSKIALPHVKHPWLCQNCCDSRSLSGNCSIVVPMLVANNRQQ